MVTMVTTLSSGETDRCKNKLRTIYGAYIHASDMLARGSIVYSEQSVFTGLGDCVASVLID